MARWQASRVATLLAAAHGGPPAELVIVSTAGDVARDVPLSEIGGQGVFVKEVQSAVLEGSADLAVHSAKDLPGETPAGLVIACVPDRADPRDAMVGSALGDLPVGAVVATGSVRRRAQLAWARPDLTFVDLRGNMALRLERAQGVGAGVLALAALERLGLGDRVAEVLSTDVVLPQVGQGALAVECRTGDEAVLEALAVIDDLAAHRQVSAERAFLLELGGGCSLPLGALATGGEQGSVHLMGMLASRDGHVVLRHSAEGQDPVALGTQLAVALLDERGGRALEDWSG